VIILEQIPKAPAAYELRKLFISGTQSWDSTQQLQDHLSLDIVKHLLSRPSSLESLIIHYVAGLSQNDFRTIFNLVKSTIGSLHVNHCVLAPNSPPFDETEERAFDAVVGEMPRIERVALIENSHDLTSSLGILRKKLSNEGLSGSFACQWRSDPTDSLQDLENALKYTGWKEVTILARQVDNYDFRVAEMIASDRGIEFTVDYHSRL